MSAKRPSIADLLLAWYDANARALPWRALSGETPDPYRVWLSEVMLQQTTVAAVRPRFAAWVARWPDLASLAAADEAEVMAAWAGLGYYARARNLLACARAVTADHGGAFPRTETGLRALPGLGAYTAAAIAAIAFGARAVVVDANVERVVARLFAMHNKGAAIRAAADAITPDARAGDFAQAMMDLGSAICTPRKPKCLLCPLADRCEGRRVDDPEAYPARKAKAAKPQRFGTVFWLEQDGAVWLVRRPARGLLGGMRALPTGAWSDTPPQARRPHPSAPSALPPSPSGRGKGPAAAGGGKGEGDRADIGGALAGAPAEAAWRLLAATVAHGFTHFDLQLALAMADAGAHQPAGVGEWWPIDALDSAGLPTVFAKAAMRMRSER